MAVAYIPAYIEDYSVFRKDRQNGLYGPLAFQLSNFLIGLPYLCRSRMTTLRVRELLTPYHSHVASPHLFPLLCHHILVKQLSSQWGRLLQMDPLHLSRPHSGGSSGGTGLLYIPYFCGRTRFSGFREWRMDGYRRIPDATTSAQPVLQIRLPL